ncbi:D-arabinono-1,4-lactone oxidase [Microbacterium sp. 22303]|uniref:D-arabinono-1,4-lactone oxidase n=1 Tax=Microbacterium sp. 22303 TaxID=3453905 RepID=UPI003F847B62
MSNLKWTNWAGTETCRPESIVKAVSVDHVREIVTDATQRGVSVRPVGSGHSFAPLVPTDGIVLDISALSGVQSVDDGAASARVWAGSRLADLGEPLWDAGLTLRNQGAIDAQTIAGAISTSTHGSGLRLQAMSAGVIGADVVTASGALIRIGADDPRLPALRASMGTLGVIVSLDLQLERAFKLKETLAFWPFAEVVDRWDEMNHAHRHFSFVRGRMYDMSAELPPIPDGMKEPTLVRIYDAVDVDAEDDATPAARLNRPYKIYPDVYTGSWEEIEPLVPYDTSMDTIQDCLELLQHYPNEYPIEARTVAGDDTWLSPMYGRDSVAIDVCRAVGKDNTPFFRAVDEVVGRYGGRPHWGKQPYFRDTETYRAMYPRWDDFAELRRQLDPTGTFLNAQLRTLFEEERSLAGRG